MCRQVSRAGIYSGKQLIVVIKTLDSAARIIFTLLTSMVILFSTEVFGNSVFKRIWPEVFYKKVVLKIFVKSTGKHLCRSLFLNKYACRL